MKKIVHSSRVAPQSFGIHCWLLVAFGGISAGCEDAATTPFGVEPEGSSGDRSTPGSAVAAGAAISHQGGASSSNRKTNRPTDTSVAGSAGTAENAGGTTATTETGVSTEPPKPGGPCAPPSTGHYQLEDIDRTNYTQLAPTLRASTCAWRCNVGNRKC